MKKEIKSSNYILEFLKVKKNRSRLYTAIFILILVVLTIVNNLEKEPETGFYPPDYYEPKTNILKAAPDFTINTVDNKIIALNKLGGKIVILNFFDPESDETIRQLSELGKVKKSFGDQIEIIGFSTKEITNKDKLSKFGFNIIKATPEIISNYKITDKLPLSVVINKKSQEYNRISGYTPERIFIRDIEINLK